METNFTPLRVLIFAALVIAFLVFALHFHPDPGNVPQLARQGQNRAWAYIILLFVIAAFMGCFNDFHYGLFPPHSLRAWIVAGSTVLMIVAVGLVLYVH